MSLVLPLILPTAAPTGNSSGGSSLNSSFNNGLNSSNHCVRVAIFADAGVLAFVTRSAAGGSGTFALAAA